MNKSPPLGISVTIWSVPVFIILMLIVPISEESDHELVNISSSVDFGILIMKLSIESSGILGSNFTGFPQKTDAFWGSNSVIFDLEKEISFFK